MAPSEPMSSIDQQGSSLGSFPTPRPLPFILTLIGLRAFDLVSSRVWWETATNIGTFFAELIRGRILRYRGCIHLTATSSGRFTPLYFFYKSLCFKTESHFKWYIHSLFLFFFSSHWYALKVILRIIRGAFCGLEYLWRSLTTSQNRRPGGTHEEDSLRPLGLNHRSVPLVRLAAQC